MPDETKNGQQEPTKIPTGLPPLESITQAIEDGTFTFIALDEYMKRANLEQRNAVLQAMSEYLRYQIDEDASQWISKRYAMTPTPLGDTGLYAFFDIGSEFEKAVRVLVESLRESRGIPSRDDWPAKPTKNMLERELRSQISEIIATSRPLRHVEKERYEGVEWYFDAMKEQKPLTPTEAYNILRRRVMEQHQELAIEATVASITMVVKLYDKFNKPQEHGLFTTIRIDERDIITPSPMFQGMIDPPDFTVDDDEMRLRKRFQLSEPSHRRVSYEAEQRSAWAFQFLKAFPNFAVHWFASIQQRRENFSANDLVEVNEVDDGMFQSE